MIRQAARRDSWLAHAQVAAWPPRYFTEGHLAVTLEQRALRKKRVI